MRTWILAFVLGIVAIAPIFYLVYHSYVDFKEPKTESIDVVENKPSNDGDLLNPLIEFKHKNTKLEKGVTIDVIACKIVDGYKFLLYLDGDQWIEGHLPVATKDEAVTFVSDLLNTETSVPTVTLLREVEDYWIVDFNLIHDNQRVSVVSLLKSKGLLLN